MWNATQVPISSRPETAFTCSKLVMKFGEDLFPQRSTIAQAGTSRTNTNQAALQGPRVILKLHKMENSKVMPSCNMGSRTITIKAIKGKKMTEFQLSLFPMHIHRSSFTLKYQWLNAILKKTMGHVLTYAWSWQITKYAEYQQFPCSHFLVSTIWILKGLSGGALQLKTCSKVFNSK